MDIDANKFLIDAIRTGIHEAIKSRMNQSYGNPFDGIIGDAVKEHGSEMRALIAESIRTCLADPDFRSSIGEQVRALVAKQLVQKFGGELEKQVNQLKNDPATRARIVLAIEEIVSQKA